VAVTPPSMVLSIATTAWSAAPDRTASIALTTSVCGRYSASSGLTTCRSATSVNVPAGPR